MTGAGGKGRSSETDSGTRPATPASLEPSAIHSDPANAQLFQAAAVASLGGTSPRDAAPPDTPSPGSEPVEDDDDAAAAIEVCFKQRLAGLRRLPPPERSAALQAARQWRLVAMRALREQRDDARAARKTARRWQRPTPPHGRGGRSTGAGRAAPR